MGFNYYSSQVNFVESGK